MFQKLIDAMSLASKIESAKEYSLGKFIKDLEGLKQDKEILIEKYYYPNGLYSWRGSYCQLALDWKKEKVVVKQLLKIAKSALNTTMTGYKGGEFFMDKNTPIHIADYGDSCFEHKKYLYNKKEKRYYDVKLIGIEDKGNFYKLKVRTENE
jgi:hypothetical protein